MRSLAYKLRLILAGILIAAGAGALAQVGGGSGISAPPTRDASLLTTGDLADARLSANVALYNGDLSQFTVGDLADARLSANVALYNGDLSQFTVGDLADARLSANVPLLNGSNVFTASANPLTVQSSAPKGMIFDETDATVDESLWDLVVEGAQFRMRALPDGAGFTNWLTVDRTGSAVDAIALSATSITANGAEVATAAGGSFSLTFATACTTTPSTTVTYSVAGNLVAWRFDGISCTSDTIGFGSGAGQVPAAIRPAVQQDVVLPVFNNAVATMGCFEISTAGTVTVEHSFCNASGSTWTASGSKGFQAITVTYSLD